MSDNIITAATVNLDVDAGNDPAAVITYLAENLGDAGRTTDPSELSRAALAREAKSATGLPGGIAIPHARAASVSTASLAFARLAHKVDFGAPDGPADLVFLIAAPEGAASDHMKLLSSLARALVRPDFVTALREAPNDARIVELVDEAINPSAPATTAATASATGASAAGATSGGAAADTAGPQMHKTTDSGKRPSIVAITACPTGIAHTYMAADALKYAAERAGVDFHVEPQGSSGTTPFTPDVIAGADAVIFATDVGVKGKSRFHGKPVIESGVKRAINEPDAMIAEAVEASHNPHASRVEGSVGDGAGTAEGTSSSLSFGKKIQQALMTGVSYMIPFVAAGGLLIALGFLLAGYQIANKTLDSSKTLSDGAYIALHNSLWDLPAGGLGQYLGGVSFAIGALAMSMLVPVLAGYISFAIADRPGIAPGFVAGLVSVAVGASFIGGLIGGLIAGAVCLAISRLPLPQWAKGLQPVIIIPLFGSLIVGGLMFMLLGKPLAWVTTQLTDGLNSMNGSSKIVLGIVLGLMMCFDLGGPVNKAAYLFATTGLAIGDTPQLEIMAAVMCAGMVPPLAMALATVIRPGLFTEPERENGKAAWFLGAAFISEGAIPFAAKDPVRVIPSMMAGGALTGALIMAFGVTQRAPHGGIFVFFTMNHWLLFLAALAAGTVLGTVCVVAAKQVGKSHTERSATPALETVAA